MSAIYLGLYKSSVLYGLTACVGGASHVIVFVVRALKHVLQGESCNTLKNIFLIYNLRVTGVLESRGCLLAATPDPW